MSGQWKGKSDSKIQGYGSALTGNQDTQKNSTSKQEQETEKEKEQEILNQVKYQSGINPMFVSTSTNK